MNPELRKEASIFKLLQMSAGVYRKNIGMIAILTIIVFVPVYILLNFIPYGYKESVLKYQAFMLQYLNEEISAAAFMNVYNTSMFKDTIVYICMTYGIELIFFPLATGGITYITKRSLRGKTVAFTGILDASMVKFVRYIVTTGIVVLMMFILSPVFIFGIYLGVYFIFYQQIIALSGRWGLSALMESRAIVKGRWFKVFGTLITIILMYAAAGQVVDILTTFAGLDANIFIYFIAFIIKKIILAFFAVVFACWFLDISRTRKAPSVIMKTGE